MRRQMTYLRVAALCVIAALTGAALAQTFDVSPYTIAGGGSTSAGGGFSVSGTMGQPAAQVPPVMSGGGFTIAGGFWPAAANACTLPADLNHDGRRDGDDVQLFANCVISGSGTCGCADMDGGGVSPASRRRPFLWSQAGERMPEGDLHPFDQVHTQAHWHGPLARSNSRASVFDPTHQ